MRATINGITVEGTPQELATFRTLQEPKKARRRVPEHFCDDSGIGCHICANPPEESTEVSDDTY